MLVVVLACFALGLAAQHAAPRSRALVRWLDDAVIVVALPALILAELLGTLV